MSELQQTEKVRMSKPIYRSVPEFVPGFGFRQWAGGDTIWQLQDEASGTNIILRRTGENSWDFRDGRPSVERTFWTGKLDQASDLLSLLIRYGGNCAEEGK